MQNQKKKPFFAKSVEQVHLTTQLCVEASKAQKEGLVNGFSFQFFVYFILFFNLQVLGRGCHLLLTLP
jgi:hypothetical protein